MKTREIIHTLSTGRVEMDDLELAEAAALSGVSLLMAQKRALEVGVWPARYARNKNTLSAKDQLKLLDSRVLLVGLGGLGGYILEILARLGVGRITGIDGDSFEPRNCNRQLLCTEETLGRSKAQAAEARVAKINPVVKFSAVSEFADAEMLRAMAGSFDLIVDALGGLKDRKALQVAATEAGIPMVSAGIAGLSGWVMTVRPGQPGPADFLGDGGASGDGVEVQTGSLAPAVSLAASLQCGEVLNLLTGKPVSAGMLLFDLVDQSFTRVCL